MTNFFFGNLLHAMCPRAYKHNPNPLPLLPPSVSPSRTALRVEGGTGVFVMTDGRKGKKWARRWGGGREGGKSKTTKKKSRPDRPNNKAKAKNNNTNCQCASRGLLPVSLVLGCFLFASVSAVSVSLAGLLACSLACSALSCFCVQREPPRLTSRVPSFGPRVFPHSSFPCLSFLPPRFVFFSSLASLLPLFPFSLAYHLQHLVSSFAGGGAKGQRARRRAGVVCVLVVNAAADRHKNTRMNPTRPRFVRPTFPPFPLSSLRVDCPLPVPIQKSACVHIYIK